MRKCSSPTTTLLRWRSINPLWFIFYHPRSTDFEEKIESRGSVIRLFVSCHVTEANCHASRQTNVPRFMGFLFVVSNVIHLFPPLSLRAAARFRVGLRNAEHFRLDSLDGSGLENLHNFRAPLVFKGKLHVVLATSSKFCISEQRLGKI